jgi:tyrosyl-tRNA synthetase
MGLGAGRRAGPVVLLVPLLVGLDGAKEGQSLNYVGLMSSPNEMFGKLMSIPDHLT